MKYYNWSEKDIENNAILKAEITDSIENTYISNNNIKGLKRDYKNATKELKKLDINLYNNLLTLLTSQMNLKFQEFSFNMPFDTMQTIVTAYQFYEYLGDEYLLNVYKELINRDNKRLRISSLEKRTNKGIGGLCFTIGEKSYVSFYSDNKITDLPSFVHETGHYFRASLAKLRKINPLYTKLFYEVEGYLMSLLSIYYLGLFQGELFSAKLFYNFFLDFLLFIKCYKAQYQLVHQFSNKENLEKINKKLIEMDGISKVYSLDELQRITCINPQENFNIINSIYIALDFFYKILEDKERGLALFKGFLISEKASVSTLLQEAEVTFYKDDNENARKMYQQVKSLQHLLK